jgi:homoserine O-acetyltransferase
MVIKHFNTSSTPAPDGGSDNPWPTPTRGFFETHDFHFDSGQTLDTLRLSYQTIGEKRYDTHGRVANAVLVLHGTGGSSTQFLTPIFASVLFSRSGLLSATKYFIILRDGIGHGESSKPSDSLRGMFPTYGYRDMVRADYLLLTEGLGVDHLRLVMGTSMGGMQSWLWAGMFPGFMDAAMPLASLPVQIAGRNRMSRKMIIDSIRLDPEWKNGEYEVQPVNGLRSALYILTWMSSIPLQWQKEAPTRDGADAFLDKRIEKALQGTDANDLMWQVASSADYDPAPLLENIRVPLVAINSADDQVNPPELGLLEEGIKKAKKGRAVVLPINDETRGHGTHTHAALWQHELKRLLEESGGLV